MDCNFLLTDPKISKSAITQWFLESSHREVFVFWCFKNARCVEFCLSEIFQCKAIAASYKAWTLRYSLRGTQTLTTSINSTQISFEKLLRHPPLISKNHRTLKDAVRHQKTPTGTSKCHSMSTWAATHPWTTFLCALERLVVSVGVCCCPELSRDTWRRCLRAYGWGVCMLVGFGCVEVCIDVLRPCMVQQMLYIWKSSLGKIPHTCQFWNIKITKPPYISSLKTIGFMYFLNFWVRQKKITIHSH